MRINGFELISSFFGFVFSNQDRNIKPYHISLYVFLWNQNNRLMWVEWFKCPFDLGMMGSGINSKHTYYKALNDLQEWELIAYKKGINDHKAPMIKLEVQKCTSTVPQGEPLPIPLLALQAELLPIPLLGRNIKLLTDNLEKVTSNIDSVLDFLNEERNNHLQINPIPSFESKSNSESEFDDATNTRIIQATEKIAGFFGISEINQANHWMKIRRFIEFQARQGKLDYLADQYTAYRKLKEKKGYKHTWLKWIGEPSDKPEPYCEGAWNKENWIKMLDELPVAEIDNNISSVSYSELHEKTLKLSNQAPSSIAAPKKNPNKVHNQVSENCLNDKEWISKLETSFDMDEYSVKEYLRKFFEETSLKEKYKLDESEAKNHFINWVNIKGGKIPKAYQKSTLTDNMWD